MTDERLDRRTVWQDNAFEVLLTQWDRRRHPLASESSTELAVLEFMLAGACRKASDGRSDVGDCNRAMLFRAGEQFAIDHPAGSSNAGLSIRIRDGAAEPLIRQMERGGSISVSTQAFGRAARLAHMLDRSMLDASQVESSVLALLECVLQQRETPPGRAAERNRVGEAQAFLCEIVDRPVSLAEVADAVDWSPWHLVRAFHRQMGISPYRYHVRLRLRLALRDVMRGGGDLTGIALRTGFSSHSHFTAAFRREFGQPPSRVMRSVRVDD